MSCLLAIETSVPDASVALWRDGQWLFEESFTSDRLHNSMIFDPLAAALAAMEGDALSAVIVGTGPGSYSGTRIGIAAAQGVAISHRCHAVGLGSLAATPVARDATSPAIAVGDARRGLYFLAPINESGEAMAAELMPKDELSLRLTEVADGVLFSLDDPAGLGLAGNLENRISRTQPQARLLVDVWLGLPRSRQLELASQPLSPSYLRAPFTSKAKPGHPLLRRG